MAILKLQATRAISKQEGWIGVKLTSIMANYNDDIGDRGRYAAPEPRAQVLEFPARTVVESPRQEEDHSHER